MRRLSIAVAAIVVSGCATVPPPVPPVVTWEEKLRWIMRLEDQRILRDPDQKPPVVLAPATRSRPAIYMPAEPNDLVRLMNDTEGRVRRRAALAAGRAGLPEAVAPLSKLLADIDPEVRQMAAFALGMIGDASARPGLQAVLNDANPIVHGRAAEALGLIGDRSDAPAVSAMVQAHVKAGVLASLGPDDLDYPGTPAIEAARLGLYALVRLGSFEALRAAALDANGQPVSHWWPIAYALQRLGDPQSAPALLTLLRTEGRMTAAFAARGLGVMKAASASDALMRIVEERRAHPAVVTQAIRALGSIGEAKAAASLIAVVTDAKADRMLRLEALTAAGAMRSSAAVDVLLDLLSERWVPLRAAAMRALAQVSPDTFVTALSGLDPDREWIVRAAQAAALGTLPAEQGVPRLITMLSDRDQRVIPAVLNALVAAKASGLEKILIEHLAADDFVVRATAATALGQIKAASAEGALAQACRAWQRDTTYVARAAAIAALAQLGAAAVPVLEEALEDGEWAVRVRAFDLLRDLGRPADPMAIRPAPAGRALSDTEWQWVLTPAFSPHAFIDTDRGTIEVELAVIDAPLTVSNFMELARRGFFNGIAIHRVVPDFVVQDGDPRGDGEGGPNHTIRDEINQRPYLRGTVGMALDWRDTGGSQFFITHSPQPHLDARYTVFGHVVNGMDVVDRIEPWDVIRRVRVWDGVTTTP
jgi:cyclophilin family peptidyl-prolyl cis-trans isomerase/HEAT repeat protein